MPQATPSRAILDHFSALRDPRQHWRVVYPLPEILLLVLCATLCGMDDFVETKLWGEQRLDFLRRFLPYERGIPAHDTLNDVVNALDPDIENAAANCGAGPVQTFALVTLPAVMPGIITGSLLMFILALNEFLVSLLLVDARIVTLPVQIYNSIRSIITPDLAAISVVFIGAAALAVALLDRLVGLDIFLKSK